MNWNPHNKMYIYVGHKPLIVEKHKFLEYLDYNSWKKYLTCIN